jgi:hypothetical protein
VEEVAVTRGLTKRQRELIEWNNRSLPPVDQTIRDLELLAVKKYETKERTKNAIRNATMALADMLSTLQSYSAYEALVARTTVETLHRRIRERVALDVRPKRRRRSVDE